MWASMTVLPPNTPNMRAGLAALTKLETEREIIEKGPH